MLLLLLLLLSLFFLPLLVFLSSSVLLLLLFIAIPVLTVDTCHIPVIRELYENLKPESKNIKQNNELAFI